MLKWFRQAKAAHPETVTDDPLATIQVHSAAGLDHREIYAVSRVNPLFYDEDVKSRVDEGLKSTVATPDLPDKSGSSGYESGDDLYASTATRATLLRDDAVTVVEQNVGYVKSILVAVRGGSPPAAPLAPIPEGKVDYTIPRPVWPPRSPRHGELTQDPVLLFTRLSYAQLPALPLPRVGTRHSKHTHSPPSSRHDTVSQDILRDLSNTIRLVFERNLHASQEELLESLSQTINENIQRLQRSSLEDSSEEALRRLSFSLSRSDPLLKMSRALSNSTGSSGGSSVQRVLLGGSPVTSNHTRAQRARLGESPVSSIDTNGTSRSQSTLLVGSSVKSHLTVTSPSEGSPVTSQHTGEPARSQCALLGGSPARSHHPEGTSRSSRPEPGSRSPSSSADSSSSSGFSDATHLPASSASSRLSQPVFTHDDLGSVSNSARNALMYGTLCRIKPSGYEKLLSTSNLNQTNNGDDRAFKNVDSLDDQSLWQTFYGPGVTAGDVKLKSSSEPLYRWPTHYPDFTLDIPTAERLMRKIKAAKKRRFWCRLVTSLLALVFFVLSVMVVSLVVTRGRRIFGSL